MIDLSSVKKAYFIGIKGAGMAALAQVLQGRGIEVWGSDTKEKFFTDRILQRAGIKVIEGFNRKNVPTQADIFVVSGAYLGSRADNPEVALANQRHPEALFGYAQVLGWLFRDKYGIAVAGTHGKSTVSAMLGLVLEQAGFDPTVIVGAQVLQWQNNVRLGASEYLVVEADEYQNKFLECSPRALILTNLEYDHPDFFENFEQYQEAFRRLVKKIPAEGFIVVNFRDKNLRRVIKSAKSRIVEYGIEPVRLKLKVPGEHNLLNASAVWRAGLELGAAKEAIKQSLADFRGTGRRFEIKGKKRGVLFIDDYAHHPTEIRVVLKTARSLYPGRKIWAVFHPHTFSRTKALLKEFARSLACADKVIVLDIYGSAREKRGGVHSRDLVREIKKQQNREVEYLPTIEQAVVYLRKKIKSERVRPIVLTMGAGDVWRLSTAF